jgi:hypothetical protein
VSHLTKELCNVKVEPSYPTCSHFHIFICNPFITMMVVKNWSTLLIVEDSTTLPYMEGCYTRYLSEGTPKILFSVHLLLNYSRP